MGEGQLEELREKSTSGNVGRRKKHKMNITREDYILRLKMVAGIAAIATSMLIGGGSLLKNKIVDRAVLSTLKCDYYDELIKGEVHRTDDHQNYWYDYGNIAQKLKGEEDFDEALYFMNLELGDEQTDKVLIYTDYKDFDNYIEQKGYASSEDFRDSMKERALVKYERDQKQKELDEMEQENTNNKVVETNKGYGEM